MRNIAIYLFSLVVALFYASPAFAQIKLCPDTAVPGQDFSALCKIDFNNIGPAIQNITIIILTIAVVIALFFLIWGGIKWIISGGDKTKVDEARKTVIAAVVGLVIAFLAFFILQLLAGFFGISIKTIVLPKIVP